METDTTDDATKTCPVCGHENVPHAQFCAKCGQALSGAGDMDEPAADETQATSTYEPVTGDQPESTWSEPEAERTTALPVQDAVWSPTRPRTEPRYVPLPTHQESPRGFILGILATVIILAVMGLYIYATWFSESLKSDIAAWLP